MIKYEFTGKTILYAGRVLRQIRALTQIKCGAYVVTPGTVGGWIENEKNLSHDDDAWVFGDAQVYDNARVYGNAQVYDNAKIEKTADYFVIGPIGSRNDITTFFRCADKSIKTKCGCFRGTLAEFAEKVDKTHGDSKHGQVYRLAIELAKKQLEEEQKHDD